MLKESVIRVENKIVFAKSISKSSNLFLIQKLSLINAARVFSENISKF